MRISRCFLLLGSFSLLAFFFILSGCGSGSGNASHTTTSNLVGTFEVSPLGTIKGQALQTDGPILGTINQNQITLQFAFREGIVTFRANVGPGGVIDATAPFPGSSDEINITGTLETLNDEPSVTNGQWSIVGTQTQGTWQVAGAKVFPASIGRYTGTLTGDVDGTMTFTIDSEAFVDSLVNFPTLQNVTVNATGFASDLNGDIAFFGQNNGSDFIVLWGTRGSSSTIPGKWFTFSGQAGTWTAGKGGTPD